MKVETTTIKRVLPLAFAIIMGLMAVSLTRQYLQQERQKLKREWQRLAETYKDPIQVVVAAADLPEGTTLEAGHLTVAAIPEHFVQPYASRLPQELVGKVTAVPIAEGEQIMSNKVRRPDQVPVGSTLSAVTPKGRRAVTIAVDAVTGVGGLVRPGDTVDILWTFKLPQAGGQEGQVVTMALFQDVPVLAIGRELMGQAKPGAGAEQPSEFTVTLALTPQETSFLLFAREQGRIQLSLRSRLDKNEAVAVAPANINSLLEAQLGVKPLGAPAAEKRTVEIYKGLQRGVVEVPESDASVAASR